MAVKHYGVWAAKPIRYDSERADRSPHIHLFFKDHPQARRELTAAINVKSLDRDSRLVFWLVRDFSHPLTSELQNLELGFQLIQQNDGLQGLDYIRTPDLISDITTGEVLHHNVSGPNNDIIDKLEPILDDAIKQDATVYLFGSSFGSGIHDIHMNQGSLPRFDNGVGQDGGLLFQFSDGHWEAVFLAFASQRIPTDDETGKSLPQSRSLAAILGVEE